MSYTNGLDKPSDYFNTNLWTGDDSNPRSITSTHATDFVWIKSRNQTYIHRLFDSVRGATKRLRSNGTDAEDTASTEVTAFTSTGYTIDSGLNSTAPTTNWVGWSWKAGGTGASNTDGSITSTVSANTTSGFSIVSYTGNSTSGATVGHGLGVEPSFFICKGRDIAKGWLCYHKSLGATKGIILNENTDAGTTSIYFNNTSPTSSVFSMGNDDKINQSGNSYIAYCFAEKKGFSKAFTYTGNGNSDGSFCYLGFRPAFVMIKGSSLYSDWGIWDNKRPDYNVVNATLQPHKSSAEVVSVGRDIDILSNGFKARGTSSSMNSSGATYVGIAFAENPFTTSTGIPTTAR
jgi:hypothetical protein